MPIWLMLLCATTLLHEASAKTKGNETKKHIHETFFGNTSLVAEKFHFVLSDGVPVRGTILTGADTDLDFKVILTFGDTNANSITTWTAIDAQRCDMRDLKGEVGFMGTIISNSANIRAACRSPTFRYAAMTAKGVDVFCKDKNPRSVAFPPVVFEQDITPTISSDRKSFEFEMDLATMQRQAARASGLGALAPAAPSSNPLSQRGFLTLMANSGSNAIFRFTDVRPLFTGLSFRLEVEVELIDRKQAAVCKRGSPNFNLPLCQYITLLTALSNPGKSFLISETFDLGTLLLAQIGEQTWLKKDGTFLVGDNGLACQIAPDPFIITLQDVGKSSLSKKPVGKFLDDSTKKMFLNSFSKSLQYEINNHCLPKGYRIDPKSLANLDAKPDEKDSQVASVHGNMYASAGKNPAGLLDCVKIVDKKMRAQNRKLKVLEYDFLIKNIWYKPGKFECDEEHEKFYACDGDRAPLTVVPPKPKPVNRTAGAAPVVWKKEGRPIKVPASTESVWSDLDTTESETTVLVIIAIATTLLLGLLAAFVVVKVMQRCARTRFYKMRQESEEAGNGQPLNEIAGGREASQDVDAAAAPAAQVIAEPNDFMAALNKSEEISL